jgi:hypothetical protein
VIVVMNLRAPYDIESFMTNSAIIILSARTLFCLRYLFLSQHMRDKYGAYNIRTSYSVLRCRNKVLSSCFSEWFNLSSTFCMNVYKTLVCIFLSCREPGLSATIEMHFAE